MVIIGLGNGLVPDCIKPLPEVMLTHLPLKKNNCHFAENSFRHTFMHEKFCILIKISLKFVPKGPIGNNPALV